MFRSFRLHVFFFLYPFRNQTGYSSTSENMPFLALKCCPWYPLKWKKSYLEISKIDRTSFSSAPIFLASFFFSQSRRILQPHLQCFTLLMDETIILRFLGDRDPGNMSVLYSCKFIFGFLVYLTRLNLSQQVPALLPSRPKIRPHRQYCRLYYQVHMSFILMICFYLSLALSSSVL